MARIRAAVFRGRRRTSVRPAPSDPGELIRACLAGDESAWSAFVDRYGDLMYTVALRTGAARDAADDVFSASLLAVYEKLGSLRDREKIVPWLAEVVRRQTLYYLRKRRPEVATGEEGVPDVEDRSPLPDEVMASLERGQLLRDALAGLRPRCRELLTALYLADPLPTSYQEIADELGIPVGSIGPTRARCLAALGEQLQAQGYRGESEEKR